MEVEQRRWNNLSVVQFGCGETGSPRFNADKSTVRRLTELKANAQGLIHRRSLHWQSVKTGSVQGKVAAPPLKRLELISFLPGCEWTDLSADCGSGELQLLTWRSTGSTAPVTHLCGSSTFRRGPAVCRSYFEKHNSFLGSIMLIDEELLPFIHGIKAIYKKM